MNLSSRKVDSLIRQSRENVKQTNQNLTRMIFSVDSVFHDVVTFYRLNNKAVN